MRTLLSGYISLANKGSTNPIIQFGEPPTAGCKWMFTFEDENLWIMSTYYRALLEIRELHVASIAHFYLGIIKALPKYYPKELYDALLVRDGQ